MFFKQFILLTSREREKSVSCEEMTVYTVAAITGTKMSCIFSTRLNITIYGSNVWCVSL